MNKVMFVMDKPKNCEKCPCFKEEINYYDGSYYTYCGIDEHLIARYKSIHCPLKSLPNNFDEKYSLLIDEEHWERFDDSNYKDPIIY